MKRQSDGNKTGPKPFYSDENVIMYICGAQLKLKYKAETETDGGDWNLSVWKSRRRARGACESAKTKLKTQNWKKRIKWRGTKKMFPPLSLFNIRYSNTWHTCHLLEYKIKTLSLSVFVLCLCENSIEGRKEGRKWRAEEWKGGREWRRHRRIPLLLLLSLEPETAALLLVGTISYSFTLTHLGFVFVTNANYYYYFVMGPSLIC